MLVWIAEQLADHIRYFSVFQYLTLRAILSAFTAFVIALLLGPYLIQRFSERRLGQSIREEVPRTHFSKMGTPTMGGVLILMAIVVSTLLWGRLDSRYLWTVLGMTIAFGTLGWIDDYIKVLQRDGRGLSVPVKFLGQAFIGLVGVIALYISASSPAETQLIVPFFKNVAIDLGWVFIPFAWLVIVGSSNAVNLTDGLDGLAILPVVLVGVALGIIAYLAGHVGFAEYLYIPYIAGSGELAVFCAALGGAGLGFLWFNTYPAQIFMGDVGALALGAALGTVAVIARHEIVFAIMGGVFVLETVSVILQVGSYKLTGKRMFRMAPIHHHFELKGWPEPRVIVRFWIITVLLVLLGLATLKLR